MLALVMTSALLAAPPVRLSITSPEAVSTDERRPAFEATKILDLQLEASFHERLPGEHVLEFKVYTPKGKLYQVLTVPFAGGGGPPRHRRLPGYPRAVAEQEMKTVGPSKHRVSALLPVAGTWIVTSSLYGSWRVDAHLDGDSRPAATQTFGLAP